MNDRFFSIRIPFFGTVAMLVLCIVCFVLPFALRGARMAIQEVQNNVADWLPADFPETVDLDEFRQHFGGESFVVVTGPWCRDGGQNTTYRKFLDLIRAESLEQDQSLMTQEEIRAHKRGDELGLLPSANYHQDWGEHNEKWLLGSENQWYWINQNGQLYRWDGQNNIVEGAQRSFERMVNGKNKADGKLIDTFGSPPGEKPNPFFSSPEKICARPFKSVSTGPEVLELMAGPGGTIRIGKSKEDDGSDLAAFEARIEAHKRLTGSLFGPTPPKNFSWTFESLLQQIEDEILLKKLQSDPEYHNAFDNFINEQVTNVYDGDFNLLVDATNDEKLGMWFRMWVALKDLEPPPRLTCMIVTLNEPVISELSRAIGRPILGKPRGRLLELATGRCGIKAENLHIGGPPADNVAIDEEGTSTLVRLVSLSLLIGIGLSYASFRSIRITIMLFFVGGVAAMSSLSYVWYAGSTMDAILMSMPSLVYVLGLSGAVHIVNYYRDACHENGREGAVETAFRQGWFPCALAAFTTSLGLVSLCTSSLTPINKFGFFASIATMATVVLLFSYLPAALTIWPADYDRKDPDDIDVDRGITGMVTGFWDSVCEFVLRRATTVAVICVLMMCFFLYGVTKIKTSVHLLKLFDPSAKILQDYQYIEEHVGKLVPAEILVSFEKQAQREVCMREERDAARELAESAGVDFDETGYEIDRDAYDLKYNLLERIELSGRIRKQLEKFFGPDGVDIVGAGMSTDVFIPLHHIDSQVLTPRIDNRRRLFNGQLEKKYNEMLREQYLARIEPGTEGYDPDEIGREMWRVSIRLAALNDVDYGEFINKLKSVVEPVLTAYRYRTVIIRELQAADQEALAIALAAIEASENSAAGENAEAGDQSDDEEIDEEAPPRIASRVLVLGPNPDFHQPEVVTDLEAIESSGGAIDQTYIFSDTLQDLFENRGYESKRGSSKGYEWVAGSDFNDEQPFPDREKWNEVVGAFSCVVLIEDHPLFDIDAIRANAKRFVDCRQHHFDIGPRGPLKGELTAMQIRENDGNNDVAAIYTGIVPIVYKAQNQLLISLIQSIGLAFCMISIVMMILLRDWRTKFSWKKLLNVRGGFIAMFPNIFPILLVFGTMGLLKRKVDIGSMMTASVAMGVAVDDTIHFLNWYRQGLEAGMRRVEAIRNAYKRVATAMTQTTLIGGLGLSAFALSTFTPTQRFGVLMLFLLAAALIGDLIFLPALLASPLGKYFGKEKPRDDATVAGGFADGEFSDGAALRVVHDDSTDTDVHPDSLRHLEQKHPGKQHDRRHGSRRKDDRRKDDRGDDGNEDPVNDDHREAGR